MIQKPYRGGCLDRLVWSRSPERSRYLHFKRCTQPFRGSSERGGRGLGGRKCHFVCSGYSCESIQTFCCDSGIHSISRPRGMDPNATSAIMSQSPNQANGRRLMNLSISWTVRTEYPKGADCSAKLSVSTA